MPPYATDLAAVSLAAVRIATQIHATPVFTCATLDRLCGRSLFFKAENLQRVGAFKFRGASNAVLALSEEVARWGVVTHSSGNHAAALALAARTRGVPATIVMPENAPPNKIAAVAGYGARIVTCAPTLAAREAAAAAAVAQTGGTLIHPYEHPDVIAGQGTIALELLDQIPDLDAVVAPIGGGGLVSGLALALREAAPRMRVFAAEPLGADDSARSKAAGRRLPLTDPRTIADGLRTSLGEAAWPVIRDLVPAVITVSEEEIVAAMRLVFERMKLVIEPSAAVPVAAVLGEGLAPWPEVRRIAVVLSGGNADLDRLPWVLG